MPKQTPRDGELLRNLGRNISKFIKKRGFETEEKFAWAVGIPKTTLSRIVRGAGDVRISKLVRIANALNVKVDDLLKE